jgi:hypothetical protein
MNGRIGPGRITMRMPGRNDAIRNASFPACRLKGCVTGEGLQPGKVVLRVRVYNLERLCYGEGVQPGKVVLLY